MTVKVYAFVMRNVIGGTLTQDIYKEIQKYQDFFNKNDHYGRGYYESKLQRLCGHDDDIYGSRNIYTRSDSDGTKIGYYGPEGWNEIRSASIIDDGDTTLIYSTLLLNHIEDNNNYDHTREPTLDMISDNISYDEQLEVAIEDYMGDKKYHTHEIQIDQYMQSTTPP